MQYDYIGRFLLDEANTTRVLYIAYRESEHGIICVTFPTQRQATGFKSMCATYLRRNNIENFIEGRDSIKFKGRCKISFRTEKPDTTKYYKVLKGGLK